jgi:hypothetical protein
LRGNVLGKLFDDVVGLRRGKAGFDRLKIAIDDLHDGSLYSKHTQGHDAHLAKVQGNLAQETARLCHRAQECGRPGAHEENGKHNHGQEFRGIMLKA